MGHFKVLILVTVMLITLGLLHESSESTIYFVTPSSSQRCPKQNCQNLSEFSSNVSNDDDNMTIVLIPGRHRLNENLSLSKLVSLNLYSLTDSSAVIACTSSAFLSFENIERVYIHNVNFVGCGGNLVKNVNEFILQKATFEGHGNSGTALTLVNTTAEIIDCTFVRNQFGTVMEDVRSLQVIISDINWFLVGNVTGIVQVGGAMISSYSSVRIRGSKFEDNRAGVGGDIFTEDVSQISIFNTTFSGEGIEGFSEEAPFGGAIFSHEGNFIITGCQFRNKNAIVGGGIMSSLSNFTINNTTFSQNSATDHGASVFGYDSTISIEKCKFEQNYAGAGAGVATQEGVLNVDASIFIDNVAERHAAALDLYQDSPTIRGCVFVNNVARSFAGAILLWFSNTLMHGKVTPEGKAKQPCNESCRDYGAMVDVSRPTPGNETVFLSNSAPTGGALYVIRSTMRSCGPIYFSENRAALYSSVYYLDSVVSFDGFVQLSQNLGSLFAFNSHLNFSDCSRFVGGSPQQSMVSSFQEGGALTLVQSRLTISGKSTFEGNSAETGGAIAATDSEIFLNDEVDIMNNSAYKNGGGIYLSQSELHALRESIVTISNNRAEKRGGGIHALSSSIKCTVTGSDYSYQDEIISELYEGALLTIIENTAQRGGALFLEANSRVTLLKDYLFYSLINVSALKFIKNKALYGGAIYVDDQSNSGSCASNPFDVNAQQSECFIHVIATQVILTANTNYILTNILFDSNVADVSGSTIFGGLLDRCGVSVFNEVDRTLDLSDNQFLTYEGDGLQYLFDISIGNTNESISSGPVQLCPCFNGKQKLQSESSSSCSDPKRRRVHSVGDGSRPCLQPGQCYHSGQSLLDRKQSFQWSGDSDI